MEYFNDILCVLRTELVKYDNGKIVSITKNDYHNWLHRGFLIIERRACRGVDALYRFDRLKPEVQKAIKEKFGDAGKSTEGSLVKLITPDPEARKFFRLHLLPNGKHLSDTKQELYSNDAALFNVTKLKFDAMRAERAKKSKSTIASGFWQRMLDDLKANDIRMMYPSNIIKLKSGRGFERKFKKYNKEGYSSLISKKEANQNATKIEGSAAAWIIARYATLINRLTLAQLFEAYKEVAIENNWKDIKTVEVLRAFLYKPEIKPLWYGARYGELKSKEKYVRQHRTLMPTKRDSLWYSDGTKLNYYYLNEKGTVSTCQVYEVIDVYSEKLLGFHVSDTEDFEAQYYAFKMAIKTAGFKPYELRYDNQGGHKKLASSDFLYNLSHLSIPTQPYNGKSKSIESVFGRFQQQFLSKDWFFTGQNITAKKEESKVNREYVLANKHKLPFKHEIIDYYKKRRDEWNNSRHHITGKSRTETYYSSTNEKAEKVEMWDMIDMFWLTTSKPSTYSAAGIEIKVKKQAYAYEVLTVEGEPDRDFMLKNIDRKFYVKYDPENMDMIALYDLDSKGDFRFITYAQPYLKIHRAIQDQEDGEMMWIQAQEIANKAQRLQQQETIEDLMQEHGLHPSQHGLKMPKPKGISKKAKEKVKSIGQATKVISNIVPSIDDNEHWLDVI